MVCRSCKNGISKIQMVLREDEWNEREEASRQVITKVSKGRALAWRLHPGTKKARKGNVGTSVEWRLNSKNDSRLHGQPSFASAIHICLS